MSRRHPLPVIRHAEKPSSKEKAHAQRAMRLTASAERRVRILQALEVARAAAAVPAVRVRAEFLPLPEGRQQDLRPADLLPAVVVDAAVELLVVAVEPALPQDLRPADLRLQRVPPLPRAEEVEVAAAAATMRRTRNRSNAPLSIRAQRSRRLIASIR
jgi:hypothetical protein